MHATRRSVGCISPGRPSRSAANDFGLKRQRIKQIVVTAGIWRERLPPDRDEFLGVNLSEDDKEALRREAARRGVSMSALTSDLIKEMLAEAKHEQEYQDRHSSERSTA